MNETLRKVLKESIKFTQDDFEIKNDLKAMMQTEGWKHLSEKLWPDLFTFLRKKGYARNTSEMSAKNILGVMEGHEITVDIVKQFVDMMEEKEILEQNGKEEEQNRYAGAPHTLEELTNGSF